MTRRNSVNTALPIVEILNFHEIAENRQRDIYFSFMRYKRPAFILVLLFCSLGWCLPASGKEKQQDTNSLYGEYEAALVTTSDPHERADTMIHYAQVMAYDPSTSGFGKIVALMALRWCDSINYDEGRVQSMIILGNHYNIVSRSDSALHYFQHALLVAEPARMQMMTELLYGNIAGIYLARSEYRNALLFYYKAVDELKRSFSISNLERISYALTVTYNNIAQALQGLYLYTQALEYSTKATAIARYSGLRELLPYTKCTQASILLQTGDIGKATALCDGLISDSVSPDVAISLRFLLGDLRLAKGDSVGALSCYSAVLQLSSWSLDRIQAICSLATLHYHLGNRDSSASYANDGLSLAVNYNAKESMLELYTLLADINSDRGSFLQAARYYSLAMPLKDSLADVDKNRLIYAMESQFRTAEKDRKIANDRLVIFQQNAIIGDKNIWLVITISLALLIISCLLFYHWHSRRMHIQKVILLQQAERTRSLLAMTQGEEKERKRIASALHDGIVGMLTAVRLHLMKAQKKKPILADDEEFNDVLMLLDQALSEVRKTAHNLMPELLLQYGLPEAIRIFCNSIQKAQQAQIDFQYYGFIGQLNKHFELFVYRMVQELIQNVLKHAKAERMLVQLSQHEHILTITVEDNGVGIAGKDIGNGTGLISILNRIHDLNGTFNIEAGKDGGTSVVIEFDLESQHALVYEY